MTTMTAPSTQSAASNRRQPVRQTRTNHARTTTNAQVAMNANQRSPSVAEDPGFFPAITHFTNSMTALPKEMIRHYTMLKEVDAKIYGPEAELGQCLSEALKNPPPPAPVSATTQDSKSTEHRLLFQRMRNVMGATLAILDEKNHVMNTTTDALDRQLRRCESSYPAIENEISEEARYGSLTHWAYTDKAGEKKSILVGERTRRSQNIQDAKEAEGAAMRSDLRREAIKSSKVRNQHVDSDFDERGVTGKRGQTGAKGRKPADSGYGANGVGLGITNTAAPPNKRRKTEKAAMGSIPMERAMNSVYGSNTGATRGREPPLAEIKKKSRVAVAPNGNTRRRGNTNTSGINSPIVSSPIMGTFPAAGSRDRQGRSPAPAMQRMPSARARQNSGPNVMTLARNRSSSMNHRHANGVNGAGVYGTTADVEKVPGFTSRPGADVKNSVKEATNPKAENRPEDIVGNDGPTDIRGGLPAGNRSNSDRNTKGEEQPEAPVGRSRAERPASISTRGNGGGSKAPSTNPTPRDSTFGDRARPPRSTAEQPQKRSHKKGAGLAAQLAAQAAQHDDEGSSVVGDDDDEDGENEPRYCYCNGVSYGEMVGCDSDTCSREWFHLQCVGLARAPAKTAKWYCDECKENLKRGKLNGGNGK